MDKNKLLKHLVFLMFFIFIADLLAKSFYWYSLVWYFDMIMHFLGGLWVGWFFIYVFLSIKRTPMSRSEFIKVILLVLLVGILWELFEYIMNIVSVTPFDPTDTASDLFFDLAGSFFSIFYFTKLIMPKIGYNRNNG